MILDRVFTPGLAQVAYLVADTLAREAAVIDPRRDVAAYLDWAQAHDVRIVAILETHVHADFVSGARELSAATDAPIYAGRLGKQRFSHRPFDDGDEVRVGSVTLRALATPGHTPEHLAYLLVDPEQGQGPIALFSGDALFVGDVGRPDLLGDTETRRLAEHLYCTVIDRLACLDDAVVVHPGHTAGSSCGKKIGDAPITTIGHEKASNYAFQTRSKDEFVRKVLDGMPLPPTYYPVLKRVNQIGPVLVAELPDGGALTAEQVAAYQGDGALVIDARTPGAFGAGHVPDAVFAGLGPSFTTWMGWLAPYDRDLILVLDDEGSYEEARNELRRIGLDRVVGFLAGGMAAWRATGRDVQTISQISVQDLARRIGGSGDGLEVLDVRSDDEWEGGHIPQAVHLFAGEILQGADAPIGGAAEVAVICGSGYRSSVTASVLQTRGVRDLVNVVGGMGAWDEAALPTTREIV